MVRVVLSCVGSDNQDKVVLHVGNDGGAAYVCLRHHDGNHAQWLGGVKTHQRRFSRRVAIENQRLLLVVSISPKGRQAGGPDRSDSRRS